MNAAAFWEELCAVSWLRDLPCKVETNRFHKILLSPYTLQRGVFQSQIGHRLSELLQEGKALIGCAVQTTDGIRAPDVSWISKERFRPHRRASSMPIAPEICVEIISRSNSREELMGKMQLYFAAGAREVWFCDENGRMEFRSHETLEPLPASRLCPEFPAVVEWE